jgi:hypothetical protein
MLERGWCTTPQSTTKKRTRSSSTKKTAPFTAGNSQDSADSDEEEEEEAEEDDEVNEEKKVDEYATAPSEVSEVVVEKEDNVENPDQTEIANDEESLKPPKAKRAKLTRSTFKSQIRPTRPDLPTSAIW